jgi:hypothetical protein
MKDVLVQMLQSIVKLIAKGHLAVAPPPTARQLTGCEADR